MILHPLHDRYNAVSNLVYGTVCTGAFAYVSKQCLTLPEPAWVPGMGMAAFTAAGVYGVVQLGKIAVQSFTHPSPS